MKNKIHDYLKKEISLAYRERDLSKVYFLRLNYSHSVVISWENGFDTLDGKDLCVSLRMNNSSYFVHDWEIVGEECSTHNNSVENITLFILNELNNKNIAA